MSEKIEIDAIDEDSDLWLVNEQIKGLLEGDGASEDHESVRAFFLATGLPAGTVDRIHRAITHGDAKAGWQELLAEVVKAREEMAGANFNSAGERIDHATASAKGGAA